MLREKRLPFLSFIAIILIIVVYSWQNTNIQRYAMPERVIASDVISYYAYLPATFIEKDYKMHFLNDPTRDYAGVYWPEKAPNGGFISKTSMGISMMYAPFFFMAHAVSEKLGYEANGFTTPYAFALIFSCVVCLLIGFLFLRKVLLKHFSDIVVALTLIIIGTGTNLYNYATLEAPMSHGYSFALFCVFLFLTEQWYTNQKWKTSIALGLVFGLIILIRPSNGLVVIVFLLFGIVKWENVIERLKLFWQNYQKIIAIILCTLIVWIPQLLYWKTITGDWFYYSYGGERFFFNDPKIFDVLFSFRKGWLLYTPVMILSLIGMGLLWKKNRQYFFPILIFFICNLYVISSWWCWWYGGGFGMRPLIESYAILAIPLATCLVWVGKQKIVLKCILSILVFALYAQSLFHSIQYYHSAIHWGNMTKEAYFDSFWRVRHSGNFYSLLEEPDYEAAKNGDGR